MALKTVVFDVGETLLDESRYWSVIADRAGVPRPAFFALLGAAIERGDHRLLWEAVGRTPAEGPPPFEPGDLYPDALPCLRRLRADGYALGLAANQPESTEAFLRGVDGVDVDFVATSAGWGVAKPSPEFFAKVVETAGRSPAEIAYVGDRVDNDVRPANRAGMVSVFLRRGPWGYIQAGDSSEARIRVDSLEQLPDALARV